MNAENVDDIPEEKLSIRFRIRMWLMFKKYYLKEYLKFMNKNDILK